MMFFSLSLALSFLHSISASASEKSVLMTSTVDPEMFRRAVSRANAETDMVHFWQVYMDPDDQDGEAFFVSDTEHESDVVKLTKDEVCTAPEAIARKCDVEQCEETLRKFVSEVTIDFVIVPRGSLEFAKSCPQKDVPEQQGLMPRTTTDVTQYLMWAYYAILFAEGNAATYAEETGKSNVYSAFALSRGFTMSPLKTWRKNKFAILDEETISIWLFEVQCAS